MTNLALRQEGDEQERRRLGDRLREARGADLALPHPLGHFKAPPAMVFGAVPKTSTGKLQKFVLREQVKSAQAIE